MAEHNVQVLIVEPGAFRTKFLAAFKTPAKSSVEHYSAAKGVLDKFEEWEGKQPGDAVKAAARIVEAVSGKGMAGKLKGKVQRLPLGHDAVARVEAKIKALSTDLDATREAAMSTNID